MAHPIMMSIKTWIIDADEQVIKQVLEISTDGRNFSTLTESPVASRSTITDEHSGMFNTV
jgi:hypothetical protein